MSQVENLQKTQHDSILPYAFKVVINVICCLRDLIFVHCKSCLEFMFLRKKKKNQDFFDHYSISPFLMFTCSEHQGFVSAAPV